VKEPEVRKILETVTDDFVRRQTDLAPEVGGEIEAGRHFHPRERGGPSWGWIAVVAIAAMAFLVVCLVLIR
jgi:hypothetical protein